MAVPVSRCVAHDRHPAARGVTVFERLGRFAARGRWAIVATWAIALVVAAPFAPRVVDVLRSGGFTLDDLESARARLLL
jgi:uncharacterized membrane protein YdfJ with MMPL/SSD domain